MHVDVQHPMQDSIQDHSLECSAAQCNVDDRVRRTRYAPNEILHFTISTE